MWRPRLAGSSRWKPGTRIVPALTAAALALSWSLPPVEAAQLPDPPRPGSRAAQEPSATQRPANALSAQYRLEEAYAGPGQAPAAGRIGQYRVAFRETIETVIEIPQAAPTRTEVVSLARYTERPVEVGDLDPAEVLGVVRRYDSVRLRPDPRVQPSDSPLLDGLTVWVEKQPTEAPLVLNLSGNRPLLEAEYRFAAYRQIFVPDLAGVLPDLPRALGQTWQLPQRVSEALVGSPIAGGALFGALESVQAAEDNTMRAVIAVTGRLQLPSSELADARALVNARVEFEFPMPTDDVGTDARAQGGIIEAKGQIVRLSLAQQNDGVSQADGRTRSTRTRELVLERRLDPANADLLPVPEPAPTPTRENSWVVHVDPEARFHFSYPQQFRAAPIPGAEESPGGLNLERSRPEGPDVISLEYRPQDRAKPEDIIQGWADFYREQRVDVAQGQSGTLEGADWPDRRVYRAELALTLPPGPGGRAQRIYFDGYILQFAQDASLLARAWTVQQDPLPFREEVEEILRTARPGSPSASGIGLGSGAGAAGRGQAGAPPSP